MSDPRRVQQQPAFLLHHRPFRDSSQILEFLSRDFGKVALVARGSRGPKSKLAGVLRSFLPLRISWVMRSDLGTLTGAEAAGAPIGLQGDALFSAWYVNELLLNFLHRHDPQPEIHALYEETLRALGQQDGVVRALRSFELELLGLLGYAVNLEHAAEAEGLDPAGSYDYQMERGPVPVARAEGPLVFTGALLEGIRRQDFDDPAVLQAASRLLRAVIAHHLGGRELKSRKVLMEVHRGRIARPGQRIPEE